VLLPVLTRPTGLTSVALSAEKAEGHFAVVLARAHLQLDSMVGGLPKVRWATWIPHGSWKDVFIGDYDYKYLFLVGQIAAVQGYTSVFSVRRVVIDSMY